MDRIGAIAEKLAPELAALRRRLHQHPELAFEEHETARVVSDFLTKAGIPFQSGIGKTGVVALVKGTKPG
ncbi:MAG TPA: amidohydrolase, partial [Burkholderiales bacterium]|nr:amidohydrolase [Burkholderiales bacterium]